jgi:hypothetical protein
MKSSLNREFALSHLFVTLLMLGLTFWFGYDGFIGYPSTPEAQLYEKIEGSKAPEGFDLKSFKAQKIKTQHGFTLLTFLAFLAVGGHLWAVKRFSFEFDDEGFNVNVKRRLWNDIKKIERKEWEKKGIIKVDGVKFDSWHHLGVKEFVEMLDKKSKGVS